VTRGDRVFAVAERELRTVLRTPAFLALVVGFLSVVLGLAWTAGAGGYLPLALDLLLPLEALVPALAFALGYRTVVADGERGELDVIRTYPLPPRAYVLGVYVGRGIVLVGTVLLALALSGLLVPLRAEEVPSVLAAHATADSPLLYVRFVVLTAVFALVALAVAVAVSAAARTSRAALALAVAGLLVVVVGLDLAAVGGLAAGALGGGLDAVLALGPASAYRGLVLESVVAAVAPGRLTAAANPLFSLVGLALWTALAFALAVVGVRT
jgi:ABC-2 type transport system permease protein